MQYLFQIVTSLIIVAVKGCTSLMTDYGSFAVMDDDLTFVKTVEKILEEIYKERSYESILIVQQINFTDPRLEGIYRLALPKIIFTTNHSFTYMAKFNSEILAVFIMSENCCQDLLETAAHILNHIRQTRIWVIALNILGKLANFKVELLELCRFYKMTNVLLTIIRRKDVLAGENYELKPYPDYHWNLKLPNIGTKALYYPQHWRNMSRKVLQTYSDQTAPRAVISQDAAGNLKFNGFVARLILLFAEHFNASLEICCPFELGQVTPYSEVNKMVDKNLVDIPLTADPVLNGQWLHRSYVYDIGSAFLMVPCAQPLTIRKIYRVLLNGYFFGYIAICAFLLSTAHSLVEFFLQDHLDWRDFVVNEKILPGILGQSSTARRSPWRVLKLIYILLFLAGLNITAQFSSQMNTLFTRPPHQRQIQSFADIKQSTLKILIDCAEAESMEAALEPIAASLEYTKNTTKYLEMRKNFNTSFGYAVNSATWDMFSRKQRYFSQAVFCSSQDLLVFPFIHWVIRLQQHSEYKEPLDYLIHRVQEMGFMEAWHSSTFGDMRRLKLISLSDPNPERGPKILDENDLLWIWLICVIGLFVGGVVFFAELLLGHCGRRCRYNLISSCNCFKSK